MLVSTRNFQVFDIRNLKTEYQILRGHKKEASAVAWHPVHEGLLSTGGSEGSNSGSIIFWLIGEEEVCTRVLTFELISIILANR